MIKNLTKKRNEGGFTLIELLVVIVILGILAAVVVFAVGGIDEKGQEAACKTDKKTLQTAEEAYFAKNDKYVDEGSLVPQYLAEASTLYNAAATGGGSGYTITVQDADCNSWP